MQSNTIIICPSIALCPANFSFSFASLLSKRCWESFIRIWLACSLAAWYTNPISQNIHNPFPSTWCTQQHCFPPFSTQGRQLFFSRHEKLGALDPLTVLCFTSINPTILPAMWRMTNVCTEKNTIHKTCKLRKSSYQCKYHPCKCRCLRPIFDEATLFFKSLTRTSAPNTKENSYQKILLGATSESVKKHLILNSTHSPSVEITSKPTGCCRLKASLFMFSNLSNLGRLNPKNNGPFRMGDIRDICPSIRRNTILHFWGRPYLQLVFYQV